VGEFGVLIIANMKSLNLVGITAMLSELKDYTLLN
jgi:hypothetical protein